MTAWAGIAAKNGKDVVIRASAPSDARRIDVN
jgi:hypothetical protein